MCKEQPVVTGGILSPEPQGTLESLTSCSGIHSPWTFDMGDELDAS